MKIKFNSLKSKERLIEMAIVNPSLSKNLSIQIEVEQRNEGSIPHVHVYHDHTRNPRECSYIRLDIPEYSTHHGKDKNKVMNKKVKDQFLKIMETEISDIAIKDLNGDFYSPTGYQFAVYTWSKTFEDSSLDKFLTDENGRIINLDYSNI